MDDHSSVPTKFVETCPSGVDDGIMTTAQVDVSLTTASNAKNYLLICVINNCK